VTEEGTFSTTLYRRGLYTSVMNLSCYVLDQSGTGSYTDDEVSPQTISGGGQLSDSFSGSAGGGATGSNAFGYGAPGGSGFGTAGGSNQTGSASTSSGQSSQDSYRFNGPATLTSHREASSLFTLHREGLGGGSGGCLSNNTFQLDQNGTTLYASSELQTRTLHDGTGTSGYVGSNNVSVRRTASLTAVV
jgi:hypothetical protein